MEPLLFLVLLVWLALSLVCQISVRTLTKMRRYDPFGLLPSWHFFAPNPARFDTIFLVRTVGEDGETSEWINPTLSYREKWWHSIYNPERRIQKSTHDLQNAIGNMAEFNTSEVISKSSPAKALLNFVLAENEVDECVEIDKADKYQFCIVRSEGTRVKPSAEVVFVSARMER